MKKFIIQIIFFLVITTLFIGIFNLLTVKVINNKASFKLAENIDKVIIGHSHPESAYNDSLIGNCSNIAQSGESYYYSYFKITQLLKKNSTLKYIFLEFTNNQLEEERNKWIWGEETLSFRYPIYSPFIDKEGYKLLIEKNFVGLLNLQVKSLMKNTKEIVTGNYDYSKKTGGYVYLVRDKTDSLLLALNEGNKLIPVSNKISNHNLYYLNKIIALCKKQKVTLFLIRSPMHPKVSNLIGEQVFNQIRTSRLNTVEFLDFKNFCLANHEFGDFTHLNYKGARKYSIFFNGLIEKDLLMKVNKQDFIDSMIIKH